MSFENYKKASKYTNSLNPDAKNKKVNEEISIELAEFDSLLPKQEPMTPNQRKEGMAAKMYQDKG
ncbi:hypothetical protein [Psychrobacillus sp. OK032]|uniref:hypothetical protein n=1 Tax=Psychrobacillus sp. OK032 TaxID=1884358 RepID=UPI0008C1E997|nr:hypothetical protein [Psychrobacillus sp. OK032]SES26479.1 hypothetical protein SAMN05518872_106286 [Psychrobacillus sp. OK032]